MENLNKYIKMQNTKLINSSYTFSGLFDIIHSNGDRIFAEFVSGFETIKVTYQEFKSYCLKMANYLVDKIHTDKNKFVGINMENSINWLACFWALLIIGYKPLLVNSRLPKSINDEIIKTMEVDTVISSVECFDYLNEIVIGSSLKPNPDVLKCDEISSFNWADEIAITSTATSLNYKICIYRGSDLTYQAINAKSIIAKNSMIKAHYKGSLKLLAFLPFYHIYGLIATYLWFSVFGRTFVFLKDYSSDTILKTIRYHNVTHIFAVPLLWHTISKEIKKKVNELSPKDKKKYDKGTKLSIKIQNLMPRLGLKISRRMFKKIVEQTLGYSIKILISGGSYIQDETLYIINSIGYPLFNGYGSTDIGITSVELSKKIKDRLKGSIGKPFDSVEYKIDDNVLYVRGKSTCSVIIPKDKEMIEVNKDEWYKTFDIASTDNKGNYYISGRCDDVYVSDNGENINPDIIEKKCLFTTITNYTFIDVDKNLSFIFEVDKNMNFIKAQKIHKEVSDMMIGLRCDGYIISKIYFTYDPIFNKNAIKVSRNQLKKKIDNHEIELIPFEEYTFKYGDSEEVIKDETYKKIKEMFAEVLDKDESELGDDSHFIFDLGGTSLDYFSLLIKLEKEFGIKFNFEDKSCSTIKEFANYILKAAKKGDKNEEV